MYNFKIIKITYSKRSPEQPMTIAKISLHCILDMYFIITLSKSGEVERTKV